MANDTDIWSQAAVGSGGETGADQGNEAQAALANAMGGQQPAAAAAQAPAAASAAGAGPGGGYDPLAGLSQIMGALGQLPGPQQQPAGAQITQRHGGLLTGLAGVLIDGLASGMAPNAQMAYQIPMQRQQQQAQMAELQLRQQQAQQELAMQPIKAKAEMAQAAINILQAGHMMRELSKEHQIDMLGAQAKYTQQAIDQGRARLDATAPTLDAAQKRTQELSAQSKDKALNFGYSVTKWDDAGNPTEYGIYESYPQGTLQKDFDYDFAGNDELGIKPEHVHLSAGMQESEARLRLSGIANEHATALKIASDQLTMKRMTEVTPVERWRAQQQMLLSQYNKDMAQQDRLQASGTSNLEKMWTDPTHGYTQFLSQAALAKQAVTDSKDGSQLASNLLPLMTVLGVTSFAGIHRVSQPEITAAGSQMGSLYRQLNTLLGKAGTGSVPAETRAEINQLVDRMINARYGTLVQGSRMVAANSRLDPSQVYILNRTGDMDTLANVLKGGGGQPGVGAGKTISKADIQKAATKNGVSFDIALKQAQDQGYDVQ